MSKDVQQRLSDLEETVESLVEENQRKEERIEELEEELEKRPPFELVGDYDPDAFGSEVIKHLQINDWPLGEYLMSRAYEEDVEKTEERVADLEEKRLEERVGELEATVDPDPNSKSYDEMSRGERVRKIRETLVDESQRRHTGKAQMTYKDVLLLFDNHPSDGYAYKLMKLAGEEEGFQYADSDGKVIRVDLDAVKDETLFHTVNNATEQEAA